MKKQFRAPTHAACGPSRTIGEVEKMAGIGPSHDERFAFWRQFAHLGDNAFQAGRAELYARIAAKAHSTPEVA